MCPWRENARPTMCGAGVRRSTHPGSADVRQHYGHTVKVPKAALIQVINSVTTKMPT